MNCHYDTVPCSPANYGSRRGAAVRYIMCHYTANDGDTSASNARYFASRSVGASAHYFVDDEGVAASVPEDCAAWAVGGEKWSDCVRTGGGTKYGECTNANSISVELCDTCRDGVHDFTEATLSNAGELVRMLMAKYGVPPERVVRHFDVNGKHCPGVPGWWGPEDAEWRKFREGLEDDMTGEEIYNLLCGYLASQPCPEWAKDGLEAAVELGVTDGSSPMLPVPRYQAALMAKKAVEIMREEKA